MQDFYKDIFTEQTLYIVCLVFLTLFTLKEFKNRYTTFRNFAKGFEYERQIARYFRNLGYKVDPRGIRLKKKDGGIDIICYKADEIILIQCKNYKYGVKQDVARKFLGDCFVYERANNLFKVKRLIIAPSKPKRCFSLFLQDIGKNHLSFMQIKYKDSNCVFLVAFFKALFLNYKKPNTF